MLSLRKVVAELGDTVSLREVDTDRSTIEQYGVADGIYLNGKKTFHGPVTEEDIREIIRKEQYLDLSSRRSEMTTQTDEETRVQA